MGEARRGTATRWSLPEKGCPLGKTQNRGTNPKLRDVKGGQIDLQKRVRKEPEHPLRVGCEKKNKTQEDQKRSTSRLGSAEKQKQLKKGRGTGEKESLPLSPQQAR